VKEKLAGMNLRIGAAAAHGRYWLFQHLGQQGFYYLLNTTHIGLTLPAPVMMAMKACVEKVSQ
jgi:hypothetical protein